MKEKGKGTSMMPFYVNNLPFVLLHFELPIFLPLV